MNLDQHESHTLCIYCSERIINEIRQIIADQDTTCDLCLDSLHNLNAMTQSLILKIQEYEWKSYHVGIKVQDKITLNEEKSLRNGLDFLPIKVFITNYINKEIDQVLDTNINKQFPDLMIKIIIKSGLRFELQIKSLYLLGKYRKLIRGIPQTKWPCSKCKGTGCIACNFSGLQYLESVEQIVAAPFLIVSKSTSESFHGAGREDIDALMLGSGRPFVLEIKNPKIRKIDIQECMDKINDSNKIEVLSMRICDKSIIKKIKQTSSSTDKTYIAELTFSNPVSANNFQQIDAILFPIILQQRTPIRVSHRRADLVRRKKIYSVQILEIVSDKIINVEIHAQGGAYIKEFISGDEGRTTPNLSNIVGVQAVCSSLDVMNVDDKGLF